MLLKLGCLTDISPGAGILAEVSKLSKLGKQGVEVEPQL